MFRRISTGVAANDAGVVVDHLYRCYLSNEGAILIKIADESYCVCPKALHKAAPNRSYSLGLPGPIQSQEQRA